MPVSSKIIISHIASFQDKFTKKKLIDAVVEKKTHKSKNKQTRHKTYRPHKDLEKIEETLNALVSSGFLKKTKGFFYRQGPFTVEGTIRINTSGNGMCRSDTGEEFIVKEGDTGRAHDGDRVTLDLLDYRRGYFYGYVKKVIQKGKTSYAARVTKKTKGLIYYRLIDLPGDNEVCSERSTNEPGENDIAFVTLDNTLLGNRPRCRVENFFSTTDEKFDFQRIVSKHSLPADHPDYAELEDIENRIPPNEHKGRKDYRELYTITIDGEDAKDFDDAISLEEKDNRYHLYVHIADVSAYVAHNSPLDREALNRGTSYYLGNRVIPMLPEKLSNDLCSLKQGVDRLTLSAEITISRNGDIIRADYYRGIIRVDRRLTYVSAHEMLESSRHETLTPLLKKMHDLALVLKKNRMKMGRLDLDIPEEKIVYDNDRAVTIVFTDRLKSHVIIEEFMLTANECVSRFLREKDVPTLHRIHEEIDEESLLVLKNFLRHLGLKLSTSGNTGTIIQDILDRVAGKEYSQVINLVVLKSMKQAYYGINPIGHFGLGFRDYTHFTSPIRRYPDLVVHRCLKTVIDTIRPLYSLTRLEYIADKSSEMERVAQKAERDLVKLKSCRLLSPKIGETFDAVISGISKYGFYVTLLEMPAEGMVPMRFLTDDYYLLKEDEFTIIGRKYSKRYRIGDRIRVKLVTVDIDLMRIDFDIA